MKTITITSTDQLRFPAVNNLVHRGLKPFGNPSVDMLIHDVLMTFDNAGHPQAFVVIAFPTDALFDDVPQIVHFHSEGGRAITRELVRATLDFVKKKGYNRLRAMNGSGAPDAVWQRTFRHEGWNIKPIATVFDFEVK